MTYAPQQPTHPPQRTWQAPDPGPAPRSIQAVFWLVVAQSALSLVVGLPVAYLSKDAILAQQPATPGVDQEAVWQAGFAFGVFAALVGCAVWLLFATKLKQGRNWARITMIVLTVVSLAYTPLNLLDTGGSSPLLFVSAVPGLAVSVAILVLLVREPAKSWTPAMTAYLKSHRW